MCDGGGTEAEGDLDDRHGEAVAGVCIVWGRKAVVDECGVRGPAHLCEVVEHHDKRAVSGQQRRAVGVCTDMVQHEAEMALEYLIFYLISMQSNGTYSVCNASMQHEPRLQATQCIHST